MDSATWQRVKAICADAVELDAGDRAAFVTERCGADVEMRREVLRLLARVCDTGPSEDGRLFFAMEFVQGVPIS